MASTMTMLKVHMPQVLFIKRFGDAGFYSTHFSVRGWYSKAVSNLLTEILRFTQVLAILKSIALLKHARGPWTATPAQIKVNIKNRQINKFFLQAKDIHNWGNFTGKRIAYVNISHF